MRTTILIIALFLSISAFAKKQDGFYEVPRKDGKIIDYPATVEFSGDSLTDAKKFTVNFPALLTGVENSFTLKKNEEGQWEGNPQLIKEVLCEENGSIYDFSCKLVFNEEAIIDVTETNGTIIKNNIEGMILVNRNITEQRLIDAFLLPQEVKDRLQSTDIFINEPIGFFKYRKFSSNY